MKFGFITIIIILTFGDLIAKKIQCPFNDTIWELKYAEVKDIEGVESIRGFAYLKEHTLLNGTIEFDIMTDGKKGYPGIFFRMKDQSNYENVYIRPHVSELATALQYTPVFNSVASWQLYHGDGFTSSVEIPRDRWVHTKIEISKNLAKVYYDDMENPALEIYQLQHEQSDGYLGISSGRNNKSFISNFSFSNIDPVLEELPKPIIPVGFINDWRLSQIFDSNSSEAEIYPTKLIESAQWEEVKANIIGLVDIAKLRKRNRGKRDLILAKTNIESSTAKQQKLKFGYSDQIEIYHNGKLIFSGDSSYKKRSGIFQGVVGLHDAVYLDLEEGENEILFKISESFGGWGFMAQKGDEIFQDNSLTRLWEIGEGLDTPESVIYDSKRDILYVTNYFSGGNEYISTISKDGEIVEKRWFEGLNRPTGGLIYNDQLYIVERKSLAIIDITTKELIKRVDIPNAQFPNDIAIDENQHIYISDNVAHKIFKILEGKVEVWLSGDSVKGTNGIMIRDKKLLLGSSGNLELREVDLDTKNISTLSKFELKTDIDGVKEFGDQLLVSDYNGRVFKVDKTGSKKLLLNCINEGFGCADFEFIESEKLLIIPSLFDNRVRGYRIKL